jgi:tight adherence protein C
MIDPLFPDLCYYFTSVPASKVKKRSERFMDEFPNAVSTIALLVNSGMILREAWREVSLSSDSELYMEMRKVNEEMDNGVSEVEALYHFGARCVTPDIKKFTALPGSTNDNYAVRLTNVLRGDEN